MAEIQKITPYFWLFGKAEEAARFYTSIFNNSRIITCFSLPEDPAGGSSFVEFELEASVSWLSTGYPKYRSPKPCRWL